MRSTKGGGGGDDEIRDIKEPGDMIRSAATSGLSGQETLYLHACIFACCYRSYPYADTSGFTRQNTAAAATANTAIPNTCETCWYGTCTNDDVVNRSALPE